MRNSIKNYFATCLKGMGMGAANVIPGVSGGTIALITGIYEELIDSIKSFDLIAIKLLLKGNVKDFLKHINFNFLFSVFLGVGISIVSLAKVLEFLFEQNELLVWSFFFGLILSSIYYVGKMVKNWTIKSYCTLIIGTAIAVVISFLKPANENDAIWYLFICGIVAVSSMILPGLSGSYVLILMGNYQLIMLRSVSDPIHHVDILLPVISGAVIGFLLLSHGISYILKKHYDATISLLTGFVIGSLLIIWPWKTAAETIMGRNGETKIISYQWELPDFSISANLNALLLIIIGIITVWGIEKMGSLISPNN